MPAISGPAHYRKKKKKKKKKKKNQTVKSSQLK